MLWTMRAIGYVRVSTDKQAEDGVSLEVQEVKIRAMAVVQGAELLDLIVDGGESAKNLVRPGMERLRDGSRMVDAFAPMNPQTANAPIKSDANKDETGDHRDTRPYQ